MLLDRVLLLQHVLSRPLPASMTAGHLQVAKSPAAPQASFPYMVTKKGVEEVAAEPVRRPEPGAQTISNTVLYQASHGS